MDYPGVFIVLIIFGIITGKIAERRGRPILVWFVFGALLFIVALPLVLILEPNEDKLRREAIELGERKRCPHCDELVRPAAKVCPHCQRDIV